MISTRRQHSGFTLVELMIALTLGLIVVGAGIFIFLSSQRSFSAQEGLSEIQESARNGIRMMTVTLRTAGYRNDPVNQIDPSSLFISPRLAIQGGESGPPPSYLGVTSTNMKSNTDSVTVAAIGNGDSGVRTCLGDAIPEGTVGVSAFYLTPANSSGISSLQCATEQGGATRKEPLITGVTDMQILYGLDSDGNLVSDKYVTATDVSDWNTVVAIQVNLTLVSSQKVVAATGSQQSGGRIQRKFATTVAIRNRLKS